MSISLYTQVGIESATRLATNLMGSHKQHVCDVYTDRAIFEAVRCIFRLTDYLVLQLSSPYQYKTYIYRLDDVSRR